MAEHYQEEAGDLMGVDEAFEMALEKLKGNSEIKRDKVYVWRQRYKEGKLSHKKFRDILERAGFKLAVEEKWIFLASHLDKNPPVRTDLVTH